MHFSAATSNASAANSSRAYLDTCYVRCGIAHASPHAPAQVDLLARLADPDVRLVAPAAAVLGDAAKTRGALAPSLRLARQTRGAVIRIRAVARGLAPR